MSSHTCVWGCAVVDLVRRPAVSTETPVHNINPAIAHLAVPVGTLTHFDGNARTHDVPMIAASLKANSQYKPLTVRRSDDPNRHNVVLAGNGTLEAARDGLGWTHVAVDYVECDDRTARRINLIDNRANDAAGYDKEALAALLEEVKAEDDWEGTGFASDDLDRLLAELDLGDLPGSVDLDRDYGDGDDANLNIATIGKKKIHMTDAELTAIGEVMDAYITEHGTLFGFIGWLAAGRA